MDYMGSSSSGLPYPNLIKEYASGDHQAFFREPVGPRSTNTLRKVPEEPIDELVKEYTPTFGSLSPVYEKEVKNRTLRLTFFREDRGTIDHGLGRNSEDEYECAKFNVLRHPHPKDDDNPNYSTDSSPVTGLNDAYLKLVNYPNIPGTVMSAPLLPRYGPLSEPTDRKDGQFRTVKAQQPSAFTRVLETTELCQKLMLEIGHRWGDLSNFTRTCQTVLFAMNKISTRVDLTKSNFLNLDKTDAQIQADRAQGHDTISASAVFLILSDIRGEYREAEVGEGDPNRSGDPSCPRGTYDRPSATQRVVHTYLLLKSIHLRGTQMRFLHLHSVPNLDTAVLRRCLGGLPNLEVLGVHNCELLHFGTAREVLDLIIYHNKEPGFKRVRSDFSPYYYTGLPRDHKGHKGEFGVVPSDHEMIETRRAIAAVLFTVVPMAIENNIDWFSPGTGMRQFLERIPFALGTVRYILEAIYSIYRFETATMRDLQRKKLPSHLFNLLRDAMRRTLNCDLVLAVEGKSMSTYTLNATMTRGEDFHLVTCGFCAARLPSYFYTTESCGRQPDQIQCSGCQLCLHLENQVDNFFQEKKETLRILFDDERFTGMDQYLNLTRVATNEEIGDSGFPFWSIAAISKEDFLHDLRTGTIGGLPGLPILDERPGPGFPNRYKRVVLWQDQVLKAAAHTHDNIDNGRERILKEIAADREDIRELTSLRARSTGEAIANRDAADNIDRGIDLKMAKCGEAQMGGKHGTNAAANWNREVVRYHQLAGVKAGTLVNNGPYPISDDCPTGFW
ncbi:hypothetical protein F4820DRAFT_459950 [Hypoxylon rubiginosum]|uniref:Uncharacterized protein n=1 Tax=Hypoxylon rubiginosum TaxID=110542 RepID=A0ACB9YVP6_9PEZI|nr:hypothetical protein F4820DRAFT_459950 [Hypoxylon rubiginosum]